MKTFPLPPIEDHRLLLRYSSSILLILAALLIQIMVRPFLGEKVFLFFFPAVFLGSLVGGLGPGVLGTVLAVAFAWFFFLPEFNSFVVNSSVHVFGLVIFSSTGLLFSFISQKSRDAYFQARRSVQARDELIAMVSHDLKNPLMAVDLKVEVLNRIAKTSPIDYDSLIEHSKPIRESIANMRKLVDVLLDIAKIEGGQFAVEKKEVALLTLVSDLKTLMEPIATKKGVILDTTNVDFRCRALCDRDRLLEVLTNIVGNAIRFTPKDGKIDVSVKSTNHFLEFRVKDNGPGIPEAEIPFVFDRFWQGRKTSNDGTGLGLSIAKGIVEAHGGKIWVRSSVGKGTTFYFTIPQYPGFASVEPMRTPENATPSAA
jgi:signal transduction histidine kinase